MILGFLIGTYMREGNTLSLSFDISPQFFLERLSREVGSKVKESIIYIRTHARAYAAPPTWVSACCYVLAITQTEN